MVLCSKTKPRKSITARHHRINPPRVKKTNSKLKLIRKRRGKKAPLVHGGFSIVIHQQRRDLQSCVGALRISAAAAADLLTERRKLSLLHRMKTP